MLVQRRGAYLVLVQWRRSDRVPGWRPIGTGGGGGPVPAGEVASAPVGAPGRATVLARVAWVAPVPGGGGGAAPLRVTDLRLVVLRGGRDRTSPPGRGETGRFCSGAGETGWSGTTDR
ncbi:hypothetical protein GCM10029963_66370 [Micromonospora andamanensis]